MFKINRRTDYAVRVMVALAKRPSGSRVPTRLVQQEMHIPPAYLQRVVAELAGAGLIQTFAGPNGGLQLGGDPQKITLLDVTEALEGKLCISDCLSVPQECPLSAECPVRSRWGYLQLAILRELAATTLSQLVEDVKQKEAPRQGLFETGVLVVESLPTHKGAA